MLLSFLFVVNVRNFSFWKLAEMSTTKPNDFDYPSSTPPFLKLSLRVKDGGTPPLENTALVRITINRNLFTPVCDLPALTPVQIQYTQALGVEFARITARDNDTQVHEDIIVAMIN